MRLAHAVDAVLARSYLAALADGAPTLEASSAYEQVLITLDWIHADEVPALHTDDVTDDRGALFEIAFSTIEELGSHGVDELHVELLLTMLTDARDGELA